ncbi:hypothetical protein G6011_07156 [Alternaria panax]|uniref:ZN622/Rei1/Reh1 zinc finger C2H2-type domain-containing protein n=1 Tax=Alternaria panax TaxID=48097 RepID=A0AAD4FAE4_9PLEO|nr:hypothetical protein G6011_07156 [Alternaria panax]
MKLTVANSVCNLRRKISELPAITEKEYEIQEGNSREVAQQPRNTDDTPLGKPRKRLHNANSENDAHFKLQIEESSDYHSGEVLSTQCLFCSFLSFTHTTALEHMSTHHGLFIPSPSAIYSLESLLSYLAVLVFEYRECLYCGKEKGTVDAVQTHMRDKGHCMIDMFELRDFWYLEVDQGYNQGREDAAGKLSDMEMRLPSGLVIVSQRKSGNNTSSKKTMKVASSRHHASQRHRNKRATAIARAEQQGQEASANLSLGQVSLHNSYNDRHPTTTPRTAQGLTGLSDQQIQTLQMVDKKMRSREESAKAKGRYAAQQQPTKAMYYKTENPVYQAG